MRTCLGMSELLRGAGMVVRTTPIEQDRWTVDWFLPGSHRLRNLYLLEQGMSPLPSKSDIHARKHQFIPPGYRSLPYSRGCLEASFMISCLEK